MASVETFRGLVAGILQQIVSWCITDINDNVSHICLIKFKGQKRKMIDVLFCHVSKVTYSKVFVYDNK